MFRFDLKTQTGLGLLLALLMGYLLSFSYGSQNPPPVTSPTPGVVQTPRPFVTLDGVWVVNATIFKTAAPEIVKVQKLDRGRITTSVGKGGMIRILDDQQTVLYEQNFDITLISGDPPKPVDSRRLFLILPIIEGGTTVEIVTPQGTDQQPAPEDE